MSEMTKFGKARKWSSLIGVVATAFVVVSMISCSKKEEFTPGSFTAVYSQTLSTSACLTCHKPGTDAYDNHGVLLDFSSSATAYSTLTTLSVTGSDAPSCGGQKIVKAGNAATSYLAAVISATYNSSYSACTPPNFHIEDGYPSTQAEIDSIVTWIQNGALND